MFGNLQTSESNVKEMIVKIESNKITQDVTNIKGTNLTILTNTPKTVKETTISERKSTSRKEKQKMAN